MIYKLRISDEALDDIDEALLWYEFRKQDLGEEFFKYLKAGFKNIQDFPLSYEKIFDNVRRCAFKKFPFSIFYRLNDITFEILVFAVFHNSRDPNVWKERIN